MELERQFATCVLLDECVVELTSRGRAHERTETRPSVCCTDELARLGTWDDREIRERETGRQGVRTKRFAFRP